MKFLLIVLLLFAAGNVFAFDLWQYPECAEENSFFASVFSPSVSFTSGFELLLPVFSFDYMTPLGLPLSLGAFLKTPSPNLKSFGVRAAYHINLDDVKTNLYFLYVFDFGFLRNDLLLEYNDEEQSVYCYDFRVGIRRFFGKTFCLSIESDFKFRGILLGLSVKLF